MHFASFEVVSIKDLKLYEGHLSFLWTLTKAGKDETGSQLLVAAGTAKIASRDQYFANHSAAKKLSRDQNF